jgi:hypothetical protein
MSCCLHCPFVTVSSVRFLCVRRSRLFWAVCIDDLGVAGMMLVRGERQSAEISSPHVVVVHGWFRREEGKGGLRS